MFVPVEYNWHKSGGFRNGKKEKNVTDKVAKGSSVVSASQKNRPERKEEGRAACCPRQERTCVRYIAGANPLQSHWRQEDGPDERKDRKRKTTLGKGKTKSDRRS